ncbi:hypothetical protein C2I18_22845 [Paenibacillus sp. PK3_47]|uniref:hypothetical protein n=1 Tax=Paenibacillus sp. PK3_47 TaxID=2072642 RepID=UPI00201E3D24|nr:hypothetical protein [Paenibacillus sp. PK3_47]UQZ36115.1 hypothetical protein C2I18_22845 [Paenibacillus sp. PK3_47]
MGRAVVNLLLGNLQYIGFLIIGLKHALLLLFVIFSIAVLLQFLLPASSREQVPIKQSVIKDIQSEFQYVKGQHNLRIIAGMYLLVGLAAGITQPLDVFITTDWLHLPKESVQWFASSEGVGMLIEGILAATISKWVHRHRRGVLTVLWPLLTAGLRIESGIAFAFFQIVFSALMIKEVHQDYIGRTNGVMVPLMMVGTLVGTSISGIIVKSFALFGAYGLAAVLIRLSAILSFRLRFQRSDAAQHHVCC